MEKLILQLTEKQYSFGDEFSNDEVLAATGGTKSSYTGKWQVIGLENGKLKLVSKANVNQLTLDGSWEETRDSYINAVTILNAAAKTNTGISTARSVTIEDIEKLAVIDKGDEYGTPHTYSNGDMVDANGNKVRASSENKVTLKDTYYEDIIEEDIKSLADGKYYLASTCINHSSWPCPEFYVRVMNNTKVTAYKLFYPWGHWTRKNFFRCPCNSLYLDFNIKDRNKFWWDNSHLFIYTRYFL